MADFHDIFNTPEETENQPETPKQASDYDMAAWKERKQQERDTAYAMSDGVALDIAYHPDRLKQYLDTQSRFSSQSVSNVLLIMEQCPNAEKVAPLSEWSRHKIRIKRNEMKNSVLMLQRGDSYMRDDGSFGRSYNVARMYHDKQSENPIKKAKSKHNDNAIMKALKESSPVPIALVNNLPDSAIAAYDRESSEIQLVLEGVNTDMLVYALSREIALARMETSDRQMPRIPEFTADCAAYMVCSRYGYDTKAYSFTGAPEVFCGADMETPEASWVRAELSDIRASAGAIIARAEKSLHPQNTERGNNNARRDNR